MTSNIFNDRATSVQSLILSRASLGCAPGSLPWQLFRRFPWREKAPGYQGWKLWKLTPTDGYGFPCAGGMHIGRPPTQYPRQGFSKGTKWYPRGKKFFLHQAWLAARRTILSGRPNQRCIFGFLFKKLNRNLLTPETMLLVSLESCDWKQIENKGCRHCQKAVGPQTELLCQSGFTTWTLSIDHVGKLHEDP